MMVRSWVTTALLATVLAHRQEESTGFVQIKEMKADISQVSSLMELKNSLKKMAANRANVPQAAIDAIDSITGELAKLLPALEAEKQQDVSDEAAVMKKFGNASTEYQGEIQIADGANEASKKSIMTAKKATHEDCRDVESLNWTAHNTCDGQQNTAQGEYDNDIEAVENAASAARDVSCDPSDEEIYALTTGNAATVQSYHDAIDALITSSGNLNSKKAECGTLLGNLNSQRGTCDADQRHYETAACTYASAYSSASSKYNGAYEEASGEYDADVGRWRSNSDNRFEQCKLVKKVTCYVAALKDNDDSDALNNAIDSCDDTSHETACAEYQFDPRAKPDAIDLNDTPATHCDAGFDYGRQAANTVLGTPNSCPCA